MCCKRTRRWKFLRLPYVLETTGVGQKGKVGIQETSSARTGARILTAPQYQGYKVTGLGHRADDSQEAIFFVDQVEGCLQIRKILG